MSILANGLTDHRVPDFRDHAAVIGRLSQTITDLAKATAYWRSNYGESSEAHPIWEAEHFGEGDSEYLAYHGPGGFSVLFGLHVAVIGAACRYSGFATIPALQAAHLPGFKALAKAVGGTRLILVPEDNGPISDAALYDGSSLDACVEIIRKTWGAPHSPTEVVTEDIEVYYRRETPIWYDERL